MQKMIGWFRMYGLKTEALSELKHYVAVNEDGYTYARCGMIEGMIEARWWTGIFAKKCRKCMVSAQADRKRMEAHAVSK